MAEVFISYKSERRPAARHLARILELNGFSVWYDYGLLPGEDFENRLMAEIAEAKVVVALWCEMSVGSPWVLKEATEAKRSGKLLPTWIQRAPPPGDFARDDIVDLTAWDGAPRSHALDRLLLDIGRRLGRPPTPRFEGLVDLDETWRAFGAPSLAAFALSAAPEARAEAPAVDVKPKPAAQPRRPAPSRFEPLSVFRDALRKPVKIGGVFGLGGREVATGPEMIVIPEGEFMMGSPENEPERTAWEGPQHPVRIGARFGLGKYAVTFDEYDAYCAASGAEKPGDAGWGRGRRPVVNVSWEDAQGYCRWLSEETGAAYRLPSEAEWEYACRAGTTTPFWWGREITPDRANYDGREVYAGGGSKGVFRGKTEPVDAFEANPFGLYQMHGNVWEWCEDAWNGSYQGAPDDGSVWAIGDKSPAVLRGGSWGDVPYGLRSAYRGRSPRDARGNDIGFRLARTLVE